MNEQPETRYARCGALSIACQWFGQDAPAIVIVPGMLGHIERTWATPPIVRFYRRLAKFARIVLYDRRGTGLSDRLPPDTLPTLEERGEDILAVMDAMGLQRATLLAFADGGPVAMQVAASHPARVASLVLYGSSARVARAPDYPIGFSEAEMEATVNAVRERWGSDAAPVFGRTMAPSVEADADWQRAVARMQRMTATPAAMVAQSRASMAVDVRALLPAITAPTLVLHATADRVFPVTHGRYLASHIPGARLLEFPGTDSTFYLENADRVANAVEELLTGRRAEPPAERAMATILFTDIVGSTRAAVSLGDRRWTDLLDEHEQALRREIGLHGGRVVDTAGDGLFAVFGVPGQAIRCAQAIQQALGAQRLQVRTGIHAGEVELRGERVAGVAVHLGARIVAAAQPGEILVSRTVKDLVAGSGIGFQDRGLHELKGLAEPWQLFAVT